MTEWNIQNQSRGHRGSRRRYFRYTRCVDSDAVCTSRQQLQYQRRYLVCISILILDSRAIGRHTNGLRNQFWENIFLIMLRNCSNDCGQRWLCGQRMLFGYLTPQLVEIDVFLGLHRVSTGLILLDENVRNIRASAQEPLIFREQFAPLCQGLWLHHRHRGSRHRENIRVRSNRRMRKESDFVTKMKYVLNETKKSQSTIRT